MAGAFKFWKRFLYQNQSKMFSFRSAYTIAGAYVWVVWKRVEQEPGTTRVSPCDNEFKELEKFYNKVKTPDKLNFLNNKSYMRLERNLRLCAEAHPGYFYKSEDSIVKGTPGKEDENQPSLEERMKRIEANTYMLGGGKDVALFLPKEEQDIKSTARIPKSEIAEDRGTLLPSGELNWRCTCIERELVGPCNVEFRAFRKHIHDSKRPDEDTTEEEIVAAREIIGTFLDCAKQNPEYYKSLFEDEDEEEDEELMAEAEAEYNKQQKELKDQQKPQGNTSNTKTIKS